MSTKYDFHWGDRLFRVYYDFNNNAPPVLHVIVDQEELSSTSVKELIKALEDGLEMMEKDT